MPKIRVKVQPPDSDCDAYHVHLPTYSMVPGSWQPIIPNKIDKDGVLIDPATGQGVELARDELARLTCEVTVPANCCDAAGKLEKAKVRAKFKGQPRWDRDDVLSDV